MTGSKKEYEIPCKNCGEYFVPIMDWNGIIKSRLCFSCLNSKKLGNASFFSGRKAQIKKASKKQGLGLKAKNDNHYYTSSGEKVTKSYIDKKIREAKKKKLDMFIKKHGYYFCEECGRNDCKPIDCSHNISVKECQESGRAELAWDVNNITLRGRPCHRKKDTSELKFKG